MYDDGIAKIALVLWEKSAHMWASVWGGKSSDRLRSLKMTDN
jgi:hypothetical protein